MLVEIGEGKKFSMESRVFAIPRNVMVGTGEMLFDHIASCLHEFVVEYKLQDKKLPLGFTFSFPCKQEGLAKVRKGGGERKRVETTNIDIYCIATMVIIMTIIRLITVITTTE